MVVAPDQHRIGVQQFRPKEADLFYTGCVDVAPSFAFPMFGKKRTKSSSVWKRLRRSATLPEGAALSAPRSCSVEAGDGVDFDEYAFGEGGDLHG